LNRARARGPESTAVRSPTGLDRSNALPQASDKGITVVVFLGLELSLSHGQLIIGLKLPFLEHGFRTCGECLSQ
jgi:hypothetical protein